MQTYFRENRLSTIKINRLDPSTSAERSVADDFEDDEVFADPAIVASLKGIGSSVGTRALATNSCDEFFDDSIFDDRAIIASLNGP